MSSSGQGSDRKERTFTGSSNASIRTNLNDKLAKLHVKHQAEIDFLEDMRSFSKQRSAIEREYSQGLQRLVQQFLAKRDIKDPPNITKMNRSENRGLMEVWKMLLQKTDEAAKARMNVAEMLLSNISEEMRQLKRVKEQTFKRLVELSQKMNSEILDSVKELVTCKKSYGDLEKVCSDARQKFTEAETRIRKGDRKLFESTQSLEKTYNKTAERLKQCQKKTTVARNEYILSIATTNAHLNKHSSDDLPSLMKAMDGEMYEKSRDIYMLYAQIEADAANLAKAQFEDLREQSYLVNRDYVVECFFHKNPVLRDRVEYRFEPHDKDTVCSINRDHGAEIFLEKDARKWASRLVKHQDTIAALEKQIKGLRSVTSAYTKNPEFGTSEAFSEAQQKITESEEGIREVQIKLAKAEARLAALREVGIDVSRHMEKAQEKLRGDRPTSDTTSTGERPMSTLLTVTQDLGASEEWLETSSMSSRSGFEDGLSIGSGRSDSGPKHCVALYDYTAQRPDELSITTDEELEVLEWDDGDGWSKGRNQRGEEGYFPQTYVRAVSPSSSPRSSSVQQVQQLMNSHLSGPLQELGSEALHEDVSVGGSGLSNGGVNIMNHNLSPSVPVTMLRAVYEYTAEDDEELTFPEGAELELVHKDDELGDGFWKGRYQGREGLFPAVVVEIISNGTCSTPILDSTLLAGTSPSSIGPSPVATFPEATPTSSSLHTSSSSSRLHPTSFNFNVSSTPKVRVQPDTPADGDLERTWRMDSFDDYDDEEVSEV